MNEDQDVTPAPRAGTRKIVTAVGVGAIGLVAGGVLAGTLSAASAESGTNGSGAYGRTGYGVPGGGDQTKPQRSDEKLLTGTTKTKVLAAVAKKYPSATVQRAETDSDGVYEVHVLLDGTPTIVQVGKDFTVTGTQTMQGGGPGRGGHGGPGDHDGDGGGRPTEGA